MTDTRSQLALVTGASGGLGAEFARQLAERGHPLVVSGRRREELDALATEITARYRVPVHVVLADLGAEGGAGTVAAAQQLVADALRVGETDHLSVLVNNAGYGKYGPFVEQDAATSTGQVAVNVLALTTLLHEVLPGMAQRRAGQVINVASTAAFQPTPTLATYAATKAYVLSLSQAVAEEVRGSGVRVTCLCPGPTDTGFFDVAGSDKIAFAGKMAPADVVRAALVANDKGRSSVIAGLVNTALAQSSRFVPRALAAKLAGRIMAH